MLHDIMVQFSIIWTLGHGSSDPTSHHRRRPVYGGSFVVGKHQIFSTIGNERTDFGARYLAS